MPAWLPPPVRAGRSPGRPPRHARGIVTLAAVLALLALAAWAAAASQQAVVSELRAAGSHQRAAEAFEAAQGGLDLARALLGAGAVDDHCLPASAPARALAQRLALGPVALACRLQGQGWSCECPASWKPASATSSAASPPSSAPAPTLSPPSFRVEASLAGAGGAVLLRSTGRGAGGSGTATVAELVRPAESGASGSSGASSSPSHWRRVPGTWRDF